VPAHPLDRAVVPGSPLPGDVLTFETPRDDEITLWSGAQRALIFGDVMLRDSDGVLHRCPDSWVARDGGPEPLRESLRKLLDLPAEHVLVAHGPLVLGDGTELARAIEA
jgi:glyoxylase-like metal-dependent hydrolase (beta-lactamase superfamily II)